MQLLVHIHQLHVIGTFVHYEALDFLAVSILKTYNPVSRLNVRTGTDDRLTKVFARSDRPDLAQIGPRPSALAAGAVTACASLRREQAGPPCYATGGLPPY